MGVVAASAFFGFILLALALFDGLGLGLGVVVFLIAYALFLNVCRAVIRHVDPWDD